LIVDTVVAREYRAAPRQPRTAVPILVGEHALRPEPAASHRSHRATGRSEYGVTSWLVRTTPSTTSNLARRSHDRNTPPHHATTLAQAKRFVINDHLEMIVALLLCDESSHVDC
jgi:hypothetical protein